MLGDDQKLTALYLYNTRHICGTTFRRDPLIVSSIINKIFL
jgi:hypothetical protein